MYYGGSEVNKLQRRYRKHYSSDGSMEITHDMQSGKTIFVTYIGGNAYSAPAIWREEHTSTAAVKALYYLQRDYLGSILAITDQNGVLKEKRHFDAWGNIVKLTNGSGTALTAFMILDRGYTGHEHLIGVGLIHMNGRLYDPILHRFLSPDNYVQDLFNTQNFNRYAYALNNPLMYTDPNGEFIVAILVGVFVGALTSAAVYTAAALITDNFSWKGFWQASAYGAVGGAIASGITAVGRTLAASAAMSGGSGAFWQSTAYGILSNTASQVGTSLIFNDPITFGTLAGGIAGGFAATKLPGFSGVKGGSLVNGAAELGYGAVRGAATGAVSGGVAAAFDGTNI